ncbi:MAG: tripartite tricarboxylate transporter substrate binding protein [Betaproteobacteria bacterium]|nr:MAG: tripartite tricarboxylate transporter substrate binding protein [Betaproteobacteria bacterium]
MTRSHAHKISGCRPPRLARTLHAAAILLAVVHPAFSLAADSPQAYPDRPVRMIVPFAPGGGSDIVGRILARGLSETWGQAVVVDNRPGAGSTVGTAIAAKAAGDGYSVLVSSSAVAFSPSLYKNLAFDIRRDFRPISLLARQPSMLVVAQSVKAATVPQLIELAKAQPGKLTYGSAGVGSATHLGGELLRTSAKVELVHVPYKSAGLAMSALLAGEIQVLVTNMATVLPHVKAGRVRSLGISSAGRSALAPEIPTVEEGGLPGFEYDTWYAMLIPATASDAIVRRLHRDVDEVLKKPAIQRQLTNQGIAIVASSPQALGAYLAAEMKKWAEIIGAAGVKS